MSLHSEIEAFKAMNDELISHHMGKFVLFHQGNFIGAFDTFHNAGSEAAKLRLPKDTFLIRQVGAPTTIPLPASIQYRVIHAAD